MLKLSPASYGPSAQARDVRVDMGEPILDPQKIPVNIQSQAKAVDYPLSIDDREFQPDLRFDGQSSCGNLPR